MYVCLCRASSRTGPDLQESGVRSNCAVCLCRASSRTGPDLQESGVRSNCAVCMCVCVELALGLDQIFMSQVLGLTVLYVCVSV